MPLNTLIFAGPDFEDRELLYPYYRFLEAGYNVKVAGLGASSYTGKCGVPIETDGSFSDFVNERFDAIVIPGGWAPDKMRMDEAALTITRNTMQQGGVVAAICHAGWVLTSADVIRGKRVTSFKAIKDDMIHAGGQWEDSPVVVDENLITSRCPADLPDFCRAILERLNSRVTAAV